MNRLPQNQRNTETGSAPLTEADRLLRVLAEDYIASVGQPRREVRDYLARPAVAPAGDGHSDAAIARTCLSNLVAAVLEGRGITLAVREARQLLGQPFAPEPPALPASDAHPDDAAVDRFAAAMKAKLARKRAQGRGGWDNPDECSPRLLAKLLIDHLPKGDPVDVGNFAMMLYNRPDADGALATEARAAHQPSEGQQ